RRRTTGGRRTRRLGHNLRLALWQSARRRTTRRRTTRRWARRWLIDHFRLALRRCRRRATRRRRRRRLVHHRRSFLLALSGLTLLTLPRPLESGGWTAKALLPLWWTARRRGRRQRTGRGRADDRGSLLLALRRLALLCWRTAEAGARSRRRRDDHRKSLLLAMPEAAAIIAARRRRQGHDECGRRREPPRRRWRRRIDIE